MTIKLNPIKGRQRLNTRCDPWRAYPVILFVCVVIGVLPLSDLTIFLLLSLTAEIGVSILLSRDILEDHRGIRLPWWQVKLELTGWQTSPELIPPPHLMANFLRESP